MGAYEFGSTAGIGDEVTVAGIKLYPNPASTILNVGGEFAFAKAELFNLQGQLMSTSTSKEINVSSLKTGMYLIRVTSQSGSIATERFIKK